MKKILITIFTVALAASAFAKTALELEAEFKALNNDWSVQTAWARQNTSDLKTAWAEFKTSPLSLLHSNPKFHTALEKLDDASKESLEAKRAMYAFYYAQVGEDFDASDEQKISINAPRFFRNNPDKLATIKSAGWIINGTQISPFVRLHVAFTIGDETLIYDVRNVFEMLSREILDDNVSQIRKLLLGMKDTEKAKDICNCYENAMLIKECVNTAKIQAVGKALTARIIDKKIGK